MKPPSWDTYRCAILGHDWHWIAGKACCRRCSIVYQPAMLKEPE